MTVVERGDRATTITVDSLLSNTESGVQGVTGAVAASSNIQTGILRDRTGRRVRCLISVVLTRLPDRLADVETPTNRFYYYGG